MRVALFGGSFDPPHRGHLTIARAAINLLNLDAVWMAPTGSQPLKLGTPATAYGDRLAMVKLAASAEHNIIASEIDRPRQDGQPNFTIDVLTEMKRSVRPGDHLFFLLGADAFLSIREWSRADDLLFVCEFVIAGRPGFPIEEPSGVLPGGVTEVVRLSGNAGERLITWRLRNSHGQVSMLHLMPDLNQHVSATDIRAAIAGEMSAEGVLCPAVLRYIEEHGLYRT